MKKKVLLSVFLLASCLSLGSCRIVGLKGDTGPTGPSGAQGEKGKDGKDGDDGESPTITISDDGYWVINGVKSNVKATGEEGQKGKDGVSIQNIEKTSTSGSVDTYTITYSDGSTSTFKVTNGVDGSQGIQGEKGDTGDKGDSGEPGTKWIYDQGNPIDLGKTSNKGDFYFDTDNGNVFTYTNSTWNYVTNFRYKIGYDGNHEFTVYSMDQIGAALAAVKDGDKIICGSNIEFDNNMFINRNIEFHFDFNGYTLSNSVDICKQYDWSFFSVRSGKMIFDDSKGTGGIKAKANDCYCLDIQNDKASIEINGGSYNGNITAVYVVAGNLVINGGYFDIQQLDDESPYGFVVNAWDAYFRNGIAKMVIKGGKYHGYNPGHATSEAGANLVPDGYQVTSETSGSDTYYSVSKVQ